MAHNNGLSELLDKLAKLASVIILFALGFRMLLVLLNALNIQLPAELVAQVYDVIINYILPNAALVLAGLVALEWGFNKGLLQTIFVIILLALCVIPQFFPEIWEQILGTLGGFAG